MCDRIGRTGPCGSLERPERSDGLGRSGSGGEERPITRDGFIHPYVPNAAPGPKRKLLEAIGAGDVTDLYAATPEALRVEGLLDLPPALPGEHDLRRQRHSRDGFLLSCDGWPPSRRCVLGAR